MCWPRPLGRRAADAGHRAALYGGIVGAIVFKLLQDSLSAITPQYWMFWIGLLLVLLVLVGRERLLRPWTWFGRGRGKEPA
jgi:branched-chain amino acid transport system permease protein